MMCTSEDEVEVVVCVGVLAWIVFVGVGDSASDGMCAVAAHCSVSGVFCFAVVFWFVVVVLVGVFAVVVAGVIVVAVVVVVLWF